MLSLAEWQRIKKKMKKCQALVETQPILLTKKLQVDLFVIERLYTWDHFDGSG